MQAGRGDGVSAQPDHHQSAERLRSQREPRHRAHLDVRDAAGGIAEQQQHGADSVSSGCRDISADYGLPLREGESTQELRQRAAAFEEQPRNNERQAIDRAVAELLGPIYVRVRCGSTRALC